jgi:transcription antitermination factor NusG
VRRGPFTGHDGGVVDRLAGSDRLQVLFSLFGRQTTVSLSEAVYTMLATRVSNAT